MGKGPMKKTKARLTNVHSYLREYYKHQRVIELAYRETTTDSWKRVTYLGEGYSPYLAYNHRQVLNNEIVIEFDDDDKKTNKALAETVCDRLRQDGISFAQWDSGNKSTHVHFLVRMKNVKNLPLFKKAVMEYYCKDLPPPDYRLASSNHLIRAEYGMHESAEEKKTMLKKTPGYPSVSKLPQEVWDLYVKKEEDSVKNRIVYKLRNISDLPGFKYILTSHKFRDVGDGHDRALFMLIHILKPSYKGKKDTDEACMFELIKFLQEWYKYSGGTKLSDEGIHGKVKYHWNRDYTISEKYLNELLHSIGKEGLIQK